MPPRLTPTFAEMVLGFLIEFLDPLTTVVPARLMCVSKYLHHKGRSLDRHNPLRYVTSCVERLVEAGGGASMSEHGYEDAFVTLLRERLPENLGNYSFSYNLRRPFRVQFNPTTSLFSVLLDTCMEFTRKPWKRGVMHGRSFRVHVCGETVREVQMHTYSHGQQLGPAFSLHDGGPDITPPGHVNLIFRTMVADMVLTECVSDIPTAYCTREWYKICGKHAPLVRHTYETFFCNEGYKKLFEPLLAREDDN